MRHPIFRTRSLADRPTAAWRAGSRAALGLAITTIAATAGAQVTGTVSQSTILTQPAMLSPTAVATFRSGMTATMLASNSILKPLGLAWAPYPLSGSRYRVLRAASSNGPWVTASDPLAPTTDTIRGLPPNTTVYVRVAALAYKSGAWVVVDTTSPAAATTQPVPSNVLRTSLQSCLVDSSPTYCYFAIAPVVCRIAPLSTSTITLSWPRRAGAHDYVVSREVQLASATTKESWAPLSSVTVTDTTFTQANAAAGMYRFVVHSRNLVKDWPAPGQYLLVIGAYSSLVSGTVPATSPPAC